MSTKPATLPRWATDLTNNDAPSSGQMDTGWTPGQTGVSDYDNYIKYWTYKWVEWLNDGDLTLNTLTVQSHITSTAGNIVASAGYIEGTNNYFFNTRTEQLDVHGTSYTSFGTTASGYKESTGAAQIHDIHINLPTGAKIYGYSFQRYGNGTDNMVHRLVKITNGGEATVGETTITAPAASWATVNNSFSPETVVGNTRYVLRVTANGANQRVGWPLVDWTYESP